MAEVGSLVIATLTLAGKLAQRYSRAKEEYEALASTVRRTSAIVQQIDHYRRSHTLPYAARAQCENSIHRITTCLTELRKVLESHAALGIKNQHIMNIYNWVSGGKRLEGLAGDIQKEIDCLDQMMKWW